MGGCHCTSVLNPQSSVVFCSSILNPQSSILNPQSSVFWFSGYKTSHFALLGGPHKFNMPDLIGLNQRETEVEREAEGDEEESETEDEFYSAEEGEDDRTKEKEIGNMYQRT